MKDVDLIQFFLDECLDVEAEIGELRRDTPVYLRKDDLDIVESLRGVNETFNDDREK